MKAIETLYNGYRFRSRLEARWAVFFDAIGIKYQYEPEGYEFTDGTKYLPDFFLPDANEYFEVKGEMNSDDWHKIEMLENESGKPVAIGYSDFTFQASQNYGQYILDGSCEDSWLCKCGKCGHLYFLGSLGSWSCPSCGHYDGDNGFDVILYGDHTSRWNNPEGQAKKALDQAKGARFEHGENGTIGKEQLIKRYCENHKNDPSVSAMIKLYEKGEEFAKQYLLRKSVETL